MKEVGGETAASMFDLVVKAGTLPATLEELVPLAFIGLAAGTSIRQESSSSGI